MSGGIEDIDAALSAAFGASVEVATLMDPKNRRRREKRMALSKDDGRRKRATGRTKQFNCKMRPDLHRRVVQTRRTANVSITVLCERALEAIVARLGGKSPAEVLALLDGQYGNGSVGTG